MKLNIRFFLPLITLVLSVGDLTAQDAPPARPDAAVLKPVGDNWLPLFNGTNLDGWKAEPEYWKGEDGILFCTGGGGGGWLSTDKEYANFELVIQRAR